MVSAGNKKLSTLRLNAAKYFNSTITRQTEQQRRLKMTNYGTTMLSK
jgi:hypothetical protein